MKKRILVLYTSIGLGHKFIAMNMVYHLQKAGYEVLAHDVLQLQEGLMVNLGKKLHEIINKHFPFVWRWLYLSKMFTVLTLPLRVPLAAGNFEHIKKVIDGFSPDCVISVHASASAAMAYMKRHKMFSGKFVIGFSDYHLHRYWLYHEADYYLANIEEQKQEMIALGIPADKISVCGITLQPLVEGNREKAREKLAIEASRKVILLASGSLGIGFTASKIAEFAKALTSTIPDSTVIIVCGKNEAMRSTLERMNLDNVKVLGFYEPMSDLYSASDVFLTKPGGLTIAESLQAGMRVIITHWLPGQEELNYQYLTTKRLVAPKLDNLTASNLAEAAKQALADAGSGETPESFAITQKNHEGKVLLETIQKILN